MNKILTMTAGILLSGCASTLPTCGTPEVTETSGCVNPWWSMLSGLDGLPKRDYVNNPITPAPVSTYQQRAGDTSDEYQTIMVNTPNGLVQKRCKVMDGYTAYCL